MNRSPSDKPRVLLATHIGYPWGGVSQRYSDLLSSNLKDRVDLHFVETSGNKKLFADAGKVSLKNVFLATTDIVRFIGAYARVKPEIVHIATAYGASFLKHSVMALFALAFGSKVVLAPHCSLKVFIPERPGAYRSYLLFVLKKCDGIIVLSSEWLTLVPLLPGVKIVYLPNAINCSAYYAIERIPSPKKPVKILYLGHIGKDKGSFDLLAAARELKDQGIPFVINIYGEPLDHGEQKKMSQMISDYELSSIVNIYPPVFGDEKFKVLRDAEIYLLPSYHEGMPISIIEAMAAGLPIVATSVGGIPDLIKHAENGFLIPVSCSSAIAASIKQLIADPLLRFQMGMESRERAQDKHDIKQYVDKLVAYYDLIMQK